MRRHWTLVAVGLLIAALAVGAIACSSSSKKNANATKTAARTSQPATTPKATAAATHAATVVSAGTPGASAGATVIVTQNTALGTILTDASGMTLYKFDQDQPNVSNCHDACPQLWPPLTIASGTPTAGAGVAGALGTIQRSDGTTQVTLGGVPLYHFSKDTAPGDTKGDGFAGHWSVIKVGG